MRFYQSLTSNGIFRVYHDGSSYKFQRLVRNNKNEVIYESKWETIEQIPSDWYEI